MSCASARRMRLVKKKKRKTTQPVRKGHRFVKSHYYMLRRGLCLALQKPFPKLSSTPLLPFPPPARRPSPPLPLPPSLPCPFPLKGKPSSVPKTPRAAWRVSCLSFTEKKGIYATLRSNCCFNRYFFFWEGPECKAVKLWKMTPE